MSQHDFYAWLSLSLGVGGLASASLGTWGYWTSSRLRRRTQAEGFFAWCEPAPGRPGQYDYVLQNTDTNPILDLVLHIGDGMRAVGLVPQGILRFNAPLLPADAIFWPVPVACWYRDSSGRYWYRDGNGKLRRGSWRGARKLKFSPWEELRAELR